MINKIKYPLSMSHNNVIEIYFYGGKLIAHGRYINQKRYGMELIRSV